MVKLLLDFQLPKSVLFIVDFLLNCPFWIKFMNFYHTGITVIEVEYPVDFTEAPLPNQAEYLVPSIFPYPAPLVLEGEIWFSESTTIK